MSLKAVQAPPAPRKVLVCTNLRNPETGRASCGAHGSIALRERLKAAVKAAGKKKEVMVMGASCLGYCPAEGCAVGILPDNEWLLSDISPEDEQALLERILRA